MLATVLLVAGAAEAQNRTTQNTRHGPFLVRANEPGTIYLRGFIGGRAHHQFRRVLEASPDPRTLVLMSEGGAVNAALAIAREVDARGIETRVPAGHGCYSACAFIFLAGQTREAQGDLGVHQIAATHENFEAGQVAIANIIEALSDFDVPREVFVRMLRTPHSEIHVFSRGDMRRLGLNRKPAPEPDAPEVLAALNRVDPEPPLPLPTRAVDFVTMNARLWSQQNERALKDIERHYALSLRYQGEPRTRHEVMTKKRVFADQWPTRRFDLIENTAIASCDFARCRVTGELRWTARSDERAAKLSGRSHLDVVLLLAGDAFLIVEEEERILARE